VQHAKRSNQQAGAREQDDGERALHDQQHGAGARGGVRSGHAAAAVAQRFLQVDLRRSCRRPQAARQRGGRGHADGKCEDDAVERDLLDAG
jgi:hypothetical protein